MRFHNNVFVELLKPIDRRAFSSIVARHDGDAYDKSFKSWDHLVALIFAQLSSETSLRGLEAAFNANSGAHYHLGTCRFTLQCGTRGVRTYFWHFNGSASITVAPVATKATCALGEVLAQPGHTSFV